MILLLSLQFYTKNITPGEQWDQNKKRKILQKKKISLVCASMSTRAPNYNRPRSFIRRGWSTRQQNTKKKLNSVSESVSKYHDTQPLYHQRRLRRSTGRGLHVPLRCTNQGRHIRGGGSCKLFFVAKTPATVPCTTQVRRGASEGSYKLSLNAATPATALCTTFHSATYVAI